MKIVEPQPYKHRDFWYYKGSSWKGEDPLSIVPGCGISNNEYKYLKFINNLWYWSN